ncbi:MAG: helix-turn-helix transcriptional regulator [Rhizobiales bacterium]|nr:helix-turn-helix transcriptional regulator [Hyphomicrobiales bacterium]
MNKNIENVFLSRLKTVVDEFETKKLAAQTAGITTMQLDRWLSGASNPPFKGLGALCERSDKTLDWLFSGKNISTQIIDIPRHSLKLSAGGGSPVDRVKFVDNIPFTCEFFQKKLPYTSITNLMIFDAAGDSMLPTINDGDLVMIDSSKNEIGDGLYAFTIDNMAHIKRLQQTIDGIIIKSDNHELYDNYELKFEDQNKIRIIGKVVWKGSLL